MSKKDKLSEEGKATVVGIARGLSMAPSDVLAIALLGALDKAMFVKTEQGEAISEEDQLKVAKEALRIVRKGCESHCAIKHKQTVDHQKAAETASSAIAAAIKSAKEAKALKEEKEGPKKDVDFKLPPGGFIAPGSDSVN